MNVEIKRTENNGIWFKATGSESGAEINGVWKGYIDGFQVMEDVDHVILAKNPESASDAELIESIEAYIEATELHAMIHEVHVVPDARMAAILANLD